MNGKEILNKLKKAIKNTDANAVVSECESGLIFISTGWLDLNIFLITLEKEFND